MTPRRLSSRKYGQNGEPFNGGLRHGEERHGVAVSVGQEGSALLREVARCEREIIDIEARLCAGHPDIAGLCMALRDWATELSSLQKRKTPLGS
ncbi:MAG: hypothetical protein JJE04_10880 [Acidobacteriia bacterium]|nr:hypothetical protein [Terriglobia bacterium]